MIYPERVRMVLASLRERQAKPWFYQWVDAAVERTSRYGQSTGPGERATSTAIVRWEPRCQEP